MGSREALPGKNILRLRKAAKLTQEELATRLHVSTQAVSKWETGRALPDILLLPRIAAELGCSTDALMGYTPGFEQISPYAQRYRGPDFYWGTAPNGLALEVLRHVYPTRPLKLLEIGCGEGRDAVFFACNGFEVSAFDVAQSGLEKAERLARAHGVQVHFFQADLRHYRPREGYDVIYASGVMHHVLPGVRTEIFESYREHTNAGGINALNVFVGKPYLPVPPDSDGDDDSWRSGELLRCYADWRTLHFREYEFDCTSGNVPHRHCVNELIAQKGAR